MGAIEILIIIGSVALVVGVIISRMIARKKGKHSCGDCSCCDCCSACKELEALKKARAEQSKTESK